MNFDTSTEAIAVFVESGADALAIGPFLVCGQGSRWNRPLHLPQASAPIAG